jgi:2-polyprenyl-3-methyl-5-hydroxy-6-metoxy-1,4-benzoquinol methylase
MRNEPDTEVAPRTSYFRRAVDLPHDGPTYRGLPILAFPGLHERVENMTSSLFPKGGRVLDLGSGSGALGLRLLDAGFKISCADAVPEAFRPVEDIPFIETNLNQDFSELFNERFQAITAIEIIEHLENPRHFLRQCKGLLEPGGRMIVSTPNLDTPRSILSFITTGCFKYFDDDFHEKDGHITPLSQWQLEKAANDTELGVLSFEGFGAPYGSGLRSLGARALSLLAKNNPRKPGVILVACLENTVD